MKKIFSNFNSISFMHKYFYNLLTKGCFASKKQSIDVVIVLKIPWKI